MKKKITYSVFIFLPIMLLLSFSNANTEEQETVEIQEPKEVTVLKLDKQEYVEHIASFGQIKNDEQIKLSLSRTGKVERLNVEEGQFVQKGQILLSLNNTEQSNSAKQVVFETEQVALLLHSLYLKREVLQKNLTSQNNLYADGISTLEVKEAAQLEYDLVNNEIRIQEEHAKGLGNKKELLGFQSGLFTLLAPQSGIIEEVMTKEQEWVGAGQQVIRFSPANALATIPLNLSAKEVSTIRKGQPANIIIDFPEKKIYKGSVKSISYNRATKRNDYKVVVAFDVTPKQLVYGTLVEVEILMDQKVEGYKIPFDAIERVGGGQVEVLLLKADSTLQKVRFAYQEIESQELLVEHGDYESIQVVTDRSVDLKEFDKVEIITYQ